MSAERMTRFYIQCLDAKGGGWNMHDSLNQCVCVVLFCSKDATNSFSSFTKKMATLIMFVPTVRCSWEFNICKNEEINDLEPHYKSPHIRALKHAVMTVLRKAQWVGNMTIHIIVISHQHYTLIYHQRPMVHFLQRTQPHPQTVNCSETVTQITTSRHFCSELPVTD